MEMLHLCGTPIFLTTQKTNDPDFSKAIPT